MKKFSVKHFLILTLCACCALCVICALSACYAPKPYYTETDGVLEYGTYGKSYSVTDCAEDVTEVTIPATYPYKGKDIPVTDIGHAFYGNKKLEKVTIPASVSKISVNAFAGCDNLKSIEVSPDNPVYSSAGNCVINREEKLLYIGCGASVIPDDGSVTVIGEEAFLGCAGLTNAHIPASVTKIGDNAFKGCVGLESISVSADNANFASVDGILYNKAKTQFLIVPKKLSGSVKVADGITEIADGLFKGRASVQNLTLPAGLTAIGESAFAGCKSLTELVIPGGVKEIGVSALSGCAGLKKLSIPMVFKGIGYNGLIGYVFGEEEYEGGIRVKQNTSVSDYFSSFSNKYYYLPEGLKSITVSGGNITDCAFIGCENLESVTVTDGVESLGAYAFYNCTNLAQITLPDSALVIENKAFFNTAYYKDKSNWENSMLYVGNHLVESDFKRSARVTVKEGTVTIAYGALNSSWVQSVTLPGSLKRICKYGISSLYLEELTIPASVTAISEGAFAYSPKLKSITVEEGNSAYYVAGNCLIDGSAKTLIAGLPDSVIPDDGSIKRIGAQAFYGCYNLEKITIPESVEQIGELAFGQTSIKEITIPQGVDYIDYYTFERCEKLETVTIPSSVTSIYNGAFTGCSSLKTVNIDCDRVYIASYAFFECESLEVINFNGTLAQWDEMFKNSNWDKGAGEYTVYCKDGETGREEEEDL